MDAFLACFFSGFSALKLLPHLVHGINGQMFSYAIRFAAL
jgi:hypothetical protein